MINSYGGVSAILSGVRCTGTRSLAVVIVTVFRGRAARCLSPTKYGYTCTRTQKKKKKKKKCSSIRNFARTKAVIGETEAYYESKHKPFYKNGIGMSERRRNNDRVALGWRLR